MSRPDRPSIAPLQQPQYQPHFLPVQSQQSRRSDPSESVSPTIGKSGSESEEDDSIFQDPSHNSFNPHLSKIKHRRRTLPHQLEVLDGLFKQCPKPDMDVRKKLAGDLGMTVREVQVWFQNRRAKAKKLAARDATEDLLSVQSSGNKLPMLPDYHQPHGPGAEFGHRFGELGGFQPSPIDAMRGQSASTSSSSAPSVGSSQDLRVLPHLGSRPPSHESVPSRTPALTPDAPLNQPFTHGTTAFDPWSRPPIPQGLAMPQAPGNIGSTAAASSLAADLLVPTNVPPPVSTVPFSLIDEDITPFTPLTPLDPFSDFSSLPISDYSAHPATLDALSLHRDLEHDISRRLSCPDGFSSSSKTFEPFASDLMPHTAYPSTTFAHQQQQPPLQPRPRSSNWGSQQMTTKLNDPASRRHSMAPLTAMQQPPSFGTTPLQPIRSDSWHMQPASTDAMGQAYVHNVGMPAWQPLSNTVAFQSRRESTSTGNKWLLDAIAEQGLTGAGDQPPAPHSPSSAAGPPAAGRRGSVVRKARSQANLYSPYPTAVPVPRDTSTGSLLDYEGF